MNGKLEGKVAVITGANSGIGLATAKRFVGEGAYVFITGRREAELNTAVKEIGRNVTAVRGDVAKLADLDKLNDIVRRVARTLPENLQKLVGYQLSGGLGFAGELGQDPVEVLRA
jgi:NAD(P)-dependent dehydrogenase (short-subunit alcohol dehydrogenase family)